MFTAVAAAGVLVVAFGFGVLPGLVALLLVGVGFLFFAWIVSVGRELRAALDGIRRSAEEIAEQSAVIAVNTNAQPDGSEPADDAET